MSRPGALLNGTANPPLIFDDFERNEIEEAEETDAEGKEKQSWIFKTFNKRTCTQFVPTKKDIRRCGCGRLDNEHTREALCIIPSPDTTWKVETNTTLEPTDAYGQLEFSGAGQTSRAKYIRIDQDTDPSDVLALLCQEWKLDLPKLLISVTGGAKNFVLHPKLKQVLRQGLLKAAGTTGAWIITGGTNTGVMKHVGEAVRGLMLTSHADANLSNQLYLIGIATWGIVNHRDVLKEDKDPVMYNMTSSMDSEGACLDNNHTHFILVDNGTSGKYGGEIGFRASLENCISKQKISNNTSHGVPVVLLVLEGGINTITTVLASVTRSPAVPVVIAEGSGRAADILAYAHRSCKDDAEGEMTEFTDVVDNRKLLLKIETAFPECTEETYLELYHNVLKCVLKKRYITIFRVDEEGVDIDRAILRALLKAQHASAADQLSLALVWNRVDIAKSEIFHENQKWEEESLNAAMMDALMNDRVEFVNLLLENGVSIGQFLTSDRLLKLYRLRSKVSVAFQQTIGEEKRVTDFSLWDINYIIGKMLGGTYGIHNEHLLSVKAGLNLGGVGMFRKRPSYMATFDHFKNPFAELFLWAVLCNMQKMALFLWERGDNNLALALVAARLYMEMAKKIERDVLKTEVLVEVQKNVQEFKDVALDLLDECFHANEEAAQKLLTYHLERFCGHSCLSLAVATEHEEFVAHASCQSLLTEIWMGAMRSANMTSLKLLMGILVPPFIHTLEFKTKQELSLLPVTLEEHQQELADSIDDNMNEEDDREQKKMWKNRRGGRVRLRTEDYTDDVEQMETTKKLRGSPPSLSKDLTFDAGLKKLGHGRRLLEFYRAPITKFWANVMAYMLFLMLFSYVILVKQRSYPYIPEVVLIVFVCTLCTEEIRQILQSDVSTADNKFKAWASSKWNICDGFAVILFFLGVGLRLNQDTIQAGHVVYSLDIMLWIIRLLDIFSVSQHLGPYVVTIGRMSVDMLYFLLIMMVFLLAYGVAQQAILYPNHPATWDIVSKIFFRPYFQIYGELFITDPIQLDNKSTEFSTPKFDTYGGTIATFIMALYLLVANILLLNMLIAIFNDTFSAVQTNANQIWKFQRYELIMEYAQRPVLVPPLIFLNHVIEVLIAMWNKLCSNRPQGHADYRLKLFLGKEELQKLMMFEEHCLYTFLHHKDTLFHATSEQRVRVMGNRVESVIAQLEELDKDSFARDTSVAKCLTGVDKRLRSLEKNTKAILNMLASLHGISPERYGAVKLTRDEDDDEDGEKAKAKTASFVLSEHSPLSKRLSAEGPPSSHTTEQDDDDDDDGGGDDDDDDDDSDDDYNKRSDKQVSEAVKRFQRASLEDRDEPRASMAATISRLSDNAIFKGP